MLKMNRHKLFNFTDFAQLKRRHNFKLDLMLLDPFVNVT